jgi:hypothetical protein
VKESRCTYARRRAYPSVIRAGATPRKADELGGHRIFVEKADCAYCHGWAGDGAPPIWGTRLDQDALIMMISCGIPGRATPTSVATA